MQTITAQPLTKCPDCNHAVSHRAESCPSCGRFFQSFRITEVIGRNWVWRIAAGVVVGYLGVLVINVILFFLFGALIAGAFMGGGNNSRPAANSTR